MGSSLLRFASPLYSIGNKGNDAHSETEQLQYRLHMTRFVMNVKSTNLFSFYQLKFILPLLKNTLYYVHQQPIIYTIKGSVQRRYKKT